MTSWTTPIQDLIQKFGPRNNFETTNLWPLLEVLTVLPEEMGSRTLRLGANRRSEVLKLFAVSTEDVLRLLVSIYCYHNVFGPSVNRELIILLTGYLLDSSVYRPFNRGSIITVFCILGSSTSRYVTSVDKLRHSRTCI